MLRKIVISSLVLIEVNCRDYFQSQSQRVQSSRIVQTIPAYTITQSAPTPTYSPQTQRTIIAAPAPSVKATPFMVSPERIALLSKIFQS